MFFDQVADIAPIAQRTGTAIFVVPLDTPVAIPNAIILQPIDKSVITIEQARGVIAKLSTRQIHDQYIIIRPAEALSAEAANALLKSLEEPGDKVHFILITEEPSQILPTILSRAAIYFLRTHDNGEIHADSRIKELAKQLLVAKGSDLVQLAETIAKHKDGVRAYALSVLGTAIEMLYKTYFITKKPVFVEKLPKFLAAYDAISRNGHVKLQIIANLC